MAHTREQTRESRAHARKLTEALSSGWRPEQVRTPIRLQSNEHCYAQSNAQLWQYLEGDSSYIHKSRIGFGLLGMAVVAGTAAGNSSRKRRAAREAAPQFRLVDQGAFFLTDMRLAIQGQMQWIDLWYENIRMSSCDGISITFHIADAPPTQLHVWPIDYYFALYHFFANGDIIEIPPDPS